MFNKMSRSNIALYITSKKNFNNKNKFSIDIIRKVFEFSYSMTFAGEGEHRNYRSGGIVHRRNTEIFCNTLQGKLSEYAIYETFKNKYHLNEPNIECYELGKWDQFDFCMKDKIVSVKSTKHYGNLLLLETKDWTTDGKYIPNDYEIIDYTFLVRIKDELTSLLKSKRLYYTDFINKEELWNMIKNLDFSFDIPGYITRDDLVYLIRNDFVIKQGEMLNGLTQMDADNYYCQVGDMRNINEFLEE